MILHQISTLSQLACRELRSVDISHPMQLRCVEGTVWITQHGVAEDLVVQQGTCVTLGCPGVVLLQALRARAVYSLTPRINGTDTADPCRMTTAIWPEQKPTTSAAARTLAARLPQRCICANGGCISSAAEATVQQEVQHSTWRLRI